MGKEKNLIGELKKFIENIKKHYSISKIILFGSRAKKEIRLDDLEHDVDLIIVSDDFDGKNFFERTGEIYDYWNLDLPVDFICYTNKEFNALKKKISIVRDALREGIVVI